MRPLDAYWRKEARRAAKQLRISKPHRTRKVRTTEGRERRRQRLLVEAVGHRGLFA